MRGQREVLCYTSPRFRMYYKLISNISNALVFRLCILVFNKTNITRNTRIGSILQSFTFLYFFQLNSNVHISI